MFTSSQLFIARLTEVEKSLIRGATNQDRLDWIYQVKHKNEVASRSVFDEAIEKINADYLEKSQSLVFGCTWKF